MTVLKMLDESPRRAISLSDVTDHFGHQCADGGRHGVSGSAKLCVTRGMPGLPELQVNRERSSFAKLRDVTFTGLLLSHP